MDLKFDWTADDFYNCEDLNRVEEWTKIINEKALEFKGSNLDLTHKIDRNESYIEFAVGYNRIEANIGNLREFLGRPYGSTEVFIGWSRYRPFTYKDANRLEANLDALNLYVQGNLDNVIRCGNYIAGAEGVI
jgi:hypothetical protein